MQNGQLVRADTNMRMQQTKQSVLVLPIVWCMVGVLTFWFPMIFFFAADNMLPSCEEDLGGFLRMYSLVMVISPLALHFCFVLVSLTGNKCLFKFGEFTMQLFSSIIGLIMNIMGYLMYNDTTDEACYDGEAVKDHDINPRTLLFAYVIMGFIGFGCQGLGSGSRIKRQE